MTREEYLNSLSKESLIELVKAQDDQLKGGDKNAWIYWRLLNWI